MVNSQRMKKEKKAELDLILTIISVPGLKCSISVLSHHSCSIAAKRCDLTIGGIWANQSLEG